MEPAAIWSWFATWKTNPKPELSKKTAACLQRFFMGI
jgi:hypothetical protein